MTDGRARTESVLLRDRLVAMIATILRRVVRFFRIEPGPRTWREQLAETSRTTAKRSNAGPGFGGPLHVLADRGKRSNTSKQADATRPRSPT